MNQHPTQDNPDPLLQTAENYCDNERSHQIHDVDDSPTISLPWILQMLFCLNGFSLNLSSLSLMYIVNTRVKIPLPYLPTYGALAFLPYSLKPFYGYLTQGISRHKLFVALLSTSGLAVLSTTWIPPGAVFLTFFNAVIRGIFDSWAELCLGLTLIDHARATTTTRESIHHCNRAFVSSLSYDDLASRFQSQAATARNFGSLLASFVTCLLFVERQLFSPEQTQLSGTVANALLIITGGFQIIGALFAHLYRNDFQPAVYSNHAFSMIAQQEQGGSDDDGIMVDEESALRDDDRSHPSYSSSQEDRDETDSLNSTFSSGAPEAQRPYRSRANWILVMLLQLIIIIIAMKGPVTERTSHMAWKVMLISLLLAIVIMAFAIRLNNWFQKSHRVGLFLILRHAIPSDSIVVGSFFYTVFESTPLLLQVLSLTGMGVATLSSWSYGKLWSRFSSGNGFLWVIAGTTVLAALASLSNLAVVASHHSSTSTIYLVFWTAVVAKALTTFCEEWAFLPDVVVATTAVSHEAENPQEERHHVVVEVPISSPEQTAASPGNNDFHENTEETTKNISIQYGTLISCIDFGDQLGSLLAGPIVAAMGISRENDFLHLNRLILLCALASALSLVLLALLRQK